VPIIGLAASREPAERARLELLRPPVCGDRHRPYGHSATDPVEVPDPLRSAAA
jgi:hypothetical protein